MLIRLLGGFSGRERAIKIRGDPPCARCKDEERVIEIARTILGKVRRASRDNELQKNVMPSGSTPLLDNTSSSLTLIPFILSRKLGGQFLRELRLREIKQNFSYKV